MYKNFIAAPLLALAVLFSCSEKETSDPGSITKGYVKGKVVDSKGAPLKNVQLLIDHTLLYNSYLSGATGDDGTYAIELTSNGGWMAYAELDVLYNGKTYNLDMHPENTTGFGKEGAIRNFTWKLTGEKPGAGHYGGTIILDKAISSSIYDSENIEFTLTPVGNLIDGSTGSVLKLHHGEPGTDTYGKLQDVAIGRYNVTALYKSTAGDVPVKLRNKLINSSAFNTTLQLDFAPSSPVGDNMAVIEYLES